MPKKRKNNIYLQALRRFLLEKDPLTSFDAKFVRFELRKNIRYHIEVNQKGINFHEITAISFLYRKDENRDKL